MLQRTWWRTHSPFGSLIRSILLASIPGWFFAGVAQTPDTPQTVSGSVLDAVSGQPVFRALVRLGSRAVLTDSEGHFSFANVDPSALNLTAIKPGYFFAEGLNEPTEISLNPGTLADPVQLRLYPEAIVKGSVSDQNGAPLANVSIEAYRNLSEGAGRRWVPVAATHSDSHGNYRIPLHGRLSHRIRLLPHFPRVRGVADGRAGGGKFHRRLACAFGRRPHSRPASLSCSAL